MSFEFRLATAIAISSMLVCSSTQTAIAQNIQPDNTLNTLVDTPDCIVCTITGGVTQNVNLFHSFEEFSVSDGGEAFFDSADVIVNIFARVTGNNLSEVNGSIGTNDANLMLLNPNGIVFLENAELNVEGSFLATSADYVDFGNEGQFSIDTLQIPSLLNITTPIGLGFGANPGPIEVLPSLTAVDPVELVSAIDNSTLALVGGELLIDFADLIVESGRIELGSVAADNFVGIVPNAQGWEFDYSQVQSFQDIQILSSDIGDDTVGNSSIQIQGENLSLDESSIFLIAVDTDTDNIVISANDTIDLVNASSIFNDAELGNAGNVIITANRLQAGDGDFTFGDSSISSGAFGEGNAGNLIINVTDEVLLQGTEFQNGDNPSGLFTQVEDDFATGNAGTLTLTTRQLTLLDGAQISAAARGDGLGGTVTITATDSVLLSGAAPEATETGGSSGIFTSAEPGSTQAGGNLTINTSELTVEDGAKISADTLGEGPAGTLTLNVDRLIVSEGGLVRSGSFAQGDGNTLSVNAAESIEISGSGFVGADPVDSEIFAAAEGTGDAGQINLFTPLLTVRDGGNIRTNSAQTSGGQINIQADSVQLLNDGDILTDVNQGQGTGGNIIIQGDSVVATGDSDILAFAREGNGGDITLPAFFGDGFEPTPPGTDLETLDGNDRVNVNATGQLTSGTITFPDVSFIENSLTELPEAPIDTAALVASSCIAPVAQQGSGRLVITGSDNTPQQPGSAGISTIATGAIRTLPDETGAVETEDGWTIGDPIAEPQAFYQLTDGRIVLSRQCL